MGKFVPTFEEFFGDLETKNIRKVAIKKQEEDDDEIYDDPDSEVIVAPEDED